MRITSWRQALSLSLLMGTSVLACDRSPGSTSPTGPDCDAEFDRATFEEKWRQCKLCEKEHRGMGTMEADCKNAIPKPWR